MPRCCPAPVLPVRCDETHEQDAGIHVQVERGGTKVAVDPAEGDGAAGVVDDPDGETKAYQEVGGCQVPQVDGNAAGRLLLSSAEVNLQGEAVQDQTHLQRDQGDNRNFIYDIYNKSYCFLRQRQRDSEYLRLTRNTRL